MLYENELFSYYLYFDFLRNESLQKDETSQRFSNSYFFWFCDYVK